MTTALKIVYKFFIGKVMINILTILTFFEYMQIRLIKSNIIMKTFVM